MTITAEAVYRNGVLRPDRPLPLSEEERVVVEIRPATDHVAETYGLLGWTGDSQTVQRVALDAEFGVSEA